MEGVEEHVDVVVVGGGNAGFSAAHAAAERGRRVVLLEKGDEDLSGGNSFYTAGATRVVHAGLDDVRDLLDDDERHEQTVLPPYFAADFSADMAKVTGGRNDPQLTEVVVTESQSTLRWLHRKGLRYRLMYERQAYERPDGTYLFWGGLHVGNTGGGQGLIADHTRVAREEGVDIRYGVAGRRLVVEDGRVVGLGWDTPDGRTGTLRADSVVLAAGGFEADADLRREHLGPGWENAKVRGTPMNTGDLLRAALAIGADRHGDWSSCHSVAWDAGGHNESNRELTNRLTRQSYPLGIVVNREGRRFVDEGADFRNYTYARYGKDILAQPGSVAYQVFDATLRPMLRSEEYDMPGVSVHQADTLEQLAVAAGIEPGPFAATVQQFNTSIDRDVPFDPTVKDGRRADVVPPKSNWAAAIETPPFYAYPVTCGITFTFGGLRSDLHGRVLDTSGEVIPGLLVCGEMLGGLFSGNYPGGTGLTAGFVFGRRAGSVA